MKIIIILLAVLAVACGGAVDEPRPTPTPEEYRAIVQPAEDAAPDAAPDADACWRCAAVGWVDECHQVVAPDAESCLHCGLRCDSGKP